MPKKKKNEITIRSSAAEYLTYVASVGGEESSVEMRYEDENIWLTQKMMATLYDVSVPAINQHSPLCGVWGRKKRPSFTLERCG